MLFDLRRATYLVALLSPFLALSNSTFAQTPAVNRSGESVSESPPIVSSEKGSISATASISVLNRYFDPLQGASSSDLVRRALASNGELLAARLDVERARARLRQAGLRPNPTIDFEQTTGRFTGAAGERETSVGIAVPLEIGGKRGRRIDLAKAELEASEAEIANR